MYPEISLEKGDFLYFLIFLYNPYISKYTMFTRTLPSPDTDIIETRDDIEQKVDERWYYLYEWISSDELRMSVLSDYLAIIRAWSTPLAIITVIAGIIGFAGGVIGTLITVLGVLGFFYLCVLAVLIMKMIYKSYLYTRGGNLVITDDHYISLGKVIEKWDYESQKSAFATLEKTFREPLLEPSGLAEHIEMQKKSLFAQLKDIALWWGKLIQNLGRSRDAGGIIIVLMIAGFLYGGMMALVYFIGVFFVSILARLFTWIAHRALIASSDTEHTIQTLFSSIDESSHLLQSAKTDSVSLLTEAGRNAWADSLSARLTESFELIDTRARMATDDTLALRQLLESSKYRDIFNFVKYGNWIKTQILAPIDEIYLLLEKNRAILDTTLSHLTSQISETPEASLQKPLILQKDRLIMQDVSIDRTMQMLEGYREKLQ